MSSAALDVLPEQRRLGRALALLGSLKLALLILPLLALGVLLAYGGGAGRVWWLVAPLAACALNLAAAIATNRRFRHNLPLLLFHLALLALIILIGIGRLMTLKAQAEVVAGTMFEGELVKVEAGPWHSNRLAQIRFANEGFSIEYAPGLRRGATRNTLRVFDDHGAARQMVIGDSEPLLISGYRFYTSFNKGFAPIFRWHPEGAAQPVMGAVHLPAYPIHEFGQAQQWTLPGSHASVWVMLQLDQPAIDAARADQFKLPDKHAIIVRMGDKRWELRPGESADITGGRLQYVELRTWMGYTIFHDWTLPWLLAACLAAVGSLGMHFFTKFNAKPW